MYQMDDLLDVVSRRVRTLGEAGSPLCSIIDQAGWEGQGWVDGRSEQFYEQLTAEDLVRAGREARQRAGAPGIFVLGFLWGALVELEDRGILALVSRVCPICGERH
jgi:hypothetical protein